MTLHKPVSEEVISLLGAGFAFSQKEDYELALEWAVRAYKAGVTDPDMLSLVELGRQYERILNARAADHTLFIDEMQVIDMEGKTWTEIDHELVHPEGCDEQCGFAWEQENMGLHDAVDECPHAPGRYPIRFWSRTPAGPGAPTEYEAGIEVIHDSDPLD